MYTRVPHYQDIGWIRTARERFHAYLLLAGRSLVGSGTSEMGYTAHVTGGMLMDMLVSARLSPTNLNVAHESDFQYLEELFEFTINHIVKKVECEPVVAALNNVCPNISVSLSEVPVDFIRDGTTRSTEGLQIFGKGKKYI